MSTFLVTLVVVVGIGALFVRPASAASTNNSSHSSSQPDPARTKIPGRDFAMRPRGIRNNNPGNIRGNVQWDGMTGVDDAGYGIFDDPVMGIRAMARNLRTYFVKHGLNTIEGIINRWAPPIENPTRDYVAFVADATGFGARQSLPLDFPTMRRLVNAIILFENGENPYLDRQIREGITRAGV